ncbi:MarC family protein [Haloflavibacter putidus]|uniref:UPF0056 membrane protein n=1 Tax=Haloflavibacter putidus TaxID=2576776 RepID=A0A507ZSH9_9FLAO|nr:MarC family protein [Haloflavibacter putidus]TQD39473.1 NAAT family transporter [Haloflavibacter putidus]
MDEFGASIWSTAVLLFFLMDPLGNIPILLSVLKQYNEKEQRKIIIRECLIAFLILNIFLFFGYKILEFLDLQKESVTIAGGIILLIIGIRMIFPKPEGVMGATGDEAPILVPIAIPMIAGPSVLAFLILMAKNEPGHLGTSFASLTIAWVLSAIIMILAPHLHKILKNRGLKAIERLMGMILVIMAVQMVINGIKLLF